MNGLELKQNRELQNKGENRIFITETRGTNKSVVYQSDVENLAIAEINKCIETNDRNDFDTELDFFIKYAKSNDYIGVMKVYFRGTQLTEESLHEIQDEVVSGIASKVNKQAHFIL